MRSVGDTRTGTGVGPSFDDWQVLKGTYARSHLHRILDATVHEIQSLAGALLEMGTDQARQAEMEAGE